MIDYLIVGQGLAGSLLAHELIRRGQRVRVLDDGHRSSSSQVAAGLLNPLAGMRFNAHPRTAEWLPAMQACYRDLARELDLPPLLHHLPMRRLFRSPQQRRFYRRRREDPATAPWVGEAFDASAAPPGVRAPHGGFLQSQTGYVALPPLLAGMRRWLAAQDALRERPVATDAVRPGPDGVRLGDEQARHLVFCEGWKLRDNPWFGWLPLQPDQGEILRLRAPRPLSREILNGAHWLVPLAEGDYRFGATHEHHRLDGRPTPQGLDELRQGLAGLLTRSDDIEVVEHAAGVRPATADRNAFLGTHPEQPRLHLFNGFGARGALSIPWYARRMADYLLQGRPLPAEADLARHA